MPKGREAFRLPKVPNMVGLRRLGYNVCNNPKIKKAKLSSVGNEMSQSNGKGKHENSSKSYIPSSINIDFILSHALNCIRYF